MMFFTILGPNVKSRRYWGETVLICIPGGKMPNYTYTKHFDTPRQYRSGLKILLIIYFQTSHRQGSRQRSRILSSRAPCRGNPANRGAVLAVARGFFSGRAHVRCASDGRAYFPDDPYLRGTTLLLVYPRSYSIEIIKQRPKYLI